MKKAFQLLLVVLCICMLSATLIGCDDKENFVTETWDKITNKDKNDGRNEEPATPEPQGEMNCTVRLAYNFDENTENVNFYDNGNVISINEDVYVFVEFSFYNVNTDNDDFVEFKLTVPAMDYISLFKLHYTGDIFAVPQEDTYIDPRTKETIKSYVVPITILAPKGERVGYIFVYKFKATAVCQEVSMSYSMAPRNYCVAQTTKSGSLSFSIVEE